MVVYEVPCIMSQTNIDVEEPLKSTCQLFALDQLTSGDYNAAITVGQQSNYLPEISCFLGNDFNDQILGVGAATIFATGEESCD